MSTTLKLRLTEELQAFVDENSGEGTPHATPNDFILDVLRDKKERLEAALVRDAILDGYGDAIQGDTVWHRGNLRQLLE